MVKYIKNNIVTLSLVIIFVALHISNHIIGDNTLFNLLCGKGINVINYEYYRLITASFLHCNWIHLICNCLALLAVGYYLECKISSLKYILYYIINLIFTSLCYYIFAGNIIDGNGSSIAIFGMFALYFVMILRYPPKYPFKINIITLYMIGYFFISSICGHKFTTVTIHAFSFANGLFFTIIGLEIINKKNQNNCLNNEKKSKEVTGYGNN